MYKFLIVIEKSETGYSAYSPDLPGCVATGKTMKEVEKLMYESIEMHIQGMLEDNIPIPEPTSTSVYAILSKPAGRTA
jgi:predicted RNase H-like HicB family nuclease